MVFAVVAIWAPGAAWAGGGQWAVSEVGTTCFNFLTDSPVDGPRIISARQPLQEVAAERDIVYSSTAGASMNAGELMQVVRNAGSIDHPTGGKAGDVLEVLGVVRVLDVNDDAALLEIVGSCREIEIGDYVRPLPEDGGLPEDLPRMRVFNDKILVTPADADAFLVMGALETVLASAEDPKRVRMTLYEMYAQRDLMVMDQGSGSSWQVGDVALIYRDRIYADSNLLRQALTVPPVLGRAVVVHADSSSSILQVVDSVAEVQIGDRARNIGTVSDFVNHPPTITCSSERDTVRYGESVRLTATVADPDGDPTTVSWSSGTGTLSSGEGETVTWTADPLDPSATRSGTASVVAVVDDGDEGGEADCTISLALAPPPAGGAAGAGAGAGGGDVLEFTCPEYPAGVTDADNRCKAVLDDVALRLRQDPRATAEIVGHSDTTGADEVNAAMSQERADKALAYLVETHGIDPGRVTTSGAGSSMPIANNDTPEGQLQNRRVVVRIIIPGE